MISVFLTFLSWIPLLPFLAPSTCNLLSPSTPSLLLDTNSWSGGSKANAIAPSPPKIPPAVSGPTSGPFGYTEKGTFFIDSQFAGFPDSIDLVYQGFVWAFTMNYPGQVTLPIVTFSAPPDHDPDHYLHLRPPCCTVGCTPSCWTKSRRRP